MNAGANGLFVHAMPALIHPAITALGVGWLKREAPAAIPQELMGQDLERVAGVPIETQRRVLEAVEREGGAEALVGLAASMRDLSGLPLLYVLLNSSSVADLIDKEQRMNRFLHSNHRVRVHELTTRTLELEHYSRFGRKPASVESLFVLGVHVVLLEEIGCHGLRAKLPESTDPKRWIVQDGGLVGGLPEGGHRRWRFDWQSFEPTRKILVGLDELLLDATKPRDFESSWTTSEQVECIVRQDLAHRWTLGEVARLCAQAPRSLQRALTREETTFTALVDRIRVEEAARLLTDPERSITEVGYACGFADTAHFSRRFRLTMGAAPSVWRRQTLAMDPAADDLANGHGTGHSAE